ncbi:MAG: baseplate J/gp47 family protein [bacterium]
MTERKNRSGTSQHDKLIPALQPEYVSVEERSIVDLLRYAREYAKKLSFYNEENKVEGSWSSFLDFLDDEEEIAKFAEFAKDPDIFRDSNEEFLKYSKPHRGLFLAFLKLLTYPKGKFAELTEKNVEFFYKNVLKLEEKEEVPDQVHVIFKLAQNVKEHLVKKGTLLYAGKDGRGADLHYEIQEDIVLNNAEISDIKTMHFHKTTSDIKSVHINNNMGDRGFEKILCLALGSVESLPDYYTAYGTMIEVDAPYLRTELYERIKGKEKDELDKSDARYIFESLCFRYLKDFLYCLDVYYREMNRGYVGITYPEDSEWEKAYRILEDVHKERIARTRRAQLKEIHKNQGFEAMMEFAFGEPYPGNMLYKMPDDISRLEHLYTANNEAARKYIEKKLCMTVDDFRVIMEKKDLSLSRIAGDEVYALLETAWAKKREYHYPAIGAETIEGLYTDTIFSLDEDERIEQFHTFGKSAKAESSENITMGFAVSSPLLQLHEGTRNIEMVISCKQGTIDYENLSALLAQKSDIFNAYLSIAGGFKKADHVDFKIGKFIIKPEVKTYDRERSNLVCDIEKYDVFDASSIDKYIVFTNSKVYKIARFDEKKNKIYLQSMNLSYPTDTTKLISKLVPKRFVAELKEELDINEYALNVKSLVETFDEHYEGNYFVDMTGKIFLIKKYINASEVDVSYCGSIARGGFGVIDEKELLLINKVWESIEPEYVEFEDNQDIHDLYISEMYSAKDEFEFEVTDRDIRIRYPEGSTAHDLHAAWEAWKDNPLNDQGRFEINKTGTAEWDVSPLSKEIEKTGEIIKRYESLEDKGIRITYRGRLQDQADLIIEDASIEDENARFLVSGDTLTITPGRVSKTVNQITAEWQAWIEKEENNPKGFHIESKDSHIWEAAPVNQMRLTQVDIQIKKCELTNLYGNGIRVWYKGPEADQPTLILKENSIDLFEFEINNEQILTIKYPSISVVSAHDLVESWIEWKTSELNDPGNFDIEQMGDGLWKIIARTEKELQPSENRIVECTIDEAGIIAMYKLSEEFENAIIEFVKDKTTTEFKFNFSDVIDATHNNKMTKQLTITYPPLLTEDDDAIQKEYQVRHVQELLSTWNKEYKKHGFFLIRKEENAQWGKGWGAEPLIVNFLDELNYVCTIDPDGFRVKYKPSGPDPIPPFSEVPKAKVVIQENDTETFAFHLSNDYPNNLKILFIKYPTIRENRTVENLINAWENEADSFVEFSIEQSGTGKWEITGITQQDLTSEVRDVTEITDPINQRFFEYKTSDVNGFTVDYTGPEGTEPEVTMEENENDTFEISVLSSYDQFNDFYIEESLTIKYPKRRDKRTIIALLKEWNKWKQSAENHLLGFEIIDTSLILEKRSKSKLLNTGDIVREYNAGAGNGICVTYRGYRNNVTLEIEQIVDFTDDDREKKIVWENGEIFSITERMDKNNVTIEYAGAIESYDTIALYEKDAICLNALKFAIALDGEFPSVVPLQIDRFSPYPVIKILNVSEAFFYKYFKSICMERIDLSVSVKGLMDIKMRGDVAMINPQNPFHPFGLTPDVSARFYFAHRDICEKKLDSMHIHFTWAGGELTPEAELPDMETYYYAYSHCGLEKAGTIKNNDFEVALKFLDQRTWLNISEEPQMLFKKTLSYNDFDNQTYQGELFSENEDFPKDPLHWPRYYKMELCNQGFMKDLYADLRNEVTRASQESVLAENNYKAVAQEIKAREASIKAAKIAEAEARVKNDPYYPPVIPEARKLPSMPENEIDISQLTLPAPYTPIIQSMSIDYTASSNMLLDNVSDNNTTTDVPVQLFRFHPFGFKEMGRPLDEDDYFLTQYDKQGYLLIGIKNLKPLQTISILVQMMSGSGDVNYSIPEIQWSYLASNEWIQFKQLEILKDTTFGLQDTGIIRFMIPEGATSTNTILPAGRLWIRAEALNNITAVPDILDIRAQSICVQYINKDNDPSHLETPLGAGTIKEMLERDYSIKEVEQPYSSFNGKREEKSENFYVRVSERLKHKNRALTLDDYEKMILSQFPQIYKVKCISQTELEILDSSNKGEIIIVVILKNVNTAPFFPLKPKTPATILSAIERYIQSYMPPMVSVKVRNPRFEEIKYRLAVKFKEGYDQGFYINKLNEDIKRFLSPWAYEKEAEISFGSSVYSSSVINYIENIEYVDYVANFSLLYQIIVHENYTEVIPLFLTEDNAATVKYPDSLLVSAESHIIDVITTDLYDAASFRGIGYMTIGTDFWISRPGPVFAAGIGAMELEAWPILRYIFTNVAVTIKVKWIVEGTEYDTEIETGFSRGDSQKIWDTLKEAGYIDTKGNVLSTIDLFAEDFDFMVSEGESFKDYLQSNLSQFSFNREFSAADFDSFAQETDDFSYSVEEITNINEVEGSIITILKTGVGFDGRSQYPFMVY